jgi:polysaccharide transporter, PST family
VTFVIIFGQVIFPTWFFQGIEKMKYITIITVIAKVFFTIFIFFFVRNQDDFIFVPLLNSLGAIMSGVISIIIIFNLYKIRLYFPSKHILLQQFKSSFFYFVSRIANNGSRYFATSIVGVYFGNVVLGYYTLVEKIFYAISSIGGVVSQAIFPYMSRTKDLIFFKKILLISMIITLALVSFLMFFNEFLLELVFGIKNELASNVFLIFFSSLIFSIPNSIIGYPLLAAFGYSKYANSSLIYASFIYLAYVLIVVMVTQNIYYTSFSVCVYMFTSLFIRLYYLKKTEILNYKNNRIR